LFNQASDRLRRLNDKIMHTWEKRAIQEVFAASAENSLVLHNSLPEFLDQIVSALNTTIDRTALRIKWDRHESRRIGKKHGQERANELNYTMDQLIFEYQILRQVIFEVMEEEEPLSAVEREVIVCAVEQAVNDAATQFSETLRDIQEKFTNMLAHDLRGPITVSKISASLVLRHSSNGAECEKLAKKIIHSMDRLDLMIHDLLDGSRVRAGEKLTLQLKDGDLNTILKQVAEDSNIGHEDRIKFKAGAPAPVACDQEALRRVIYNLLTNALKFSTPESPITVELSRSARRYTISVHNVGPAIAPEDQASLFEQYRRSRNAAGKKGWGLGLTVVQGLTRAHGGTVEVESSPEHGTTFRVHLPSVVQNQAEAPV